MELLMKFRLSKSKLVDTPIIQGSKIRKNNGDLLTNVTKYWQIIECLQYLTLTSSDIDYSVNQVSQFLQTPPISHLKVAYSSFYQGYIR